MVSKLVESLAAGLEQYLAFEERIASVKAQAEREYGQPCTIHFHAVAKGEVQPMDTILLVTVGIIKKARQERILDVGRKA